MSKKYVVRAGAANPCGRHPFVCCCSNSTLMGAVVEGRLAKSWRAAKLADYMYYLGHIGGIVLVAADRVLRC